MSQGAGNSDRIHENWSRCDHDEDVTERPGPLRTGAEIMPSSVQNGQAYFRKGRPLMTDQKNRQWILSARPAGKLTGNEFRWNEAPMPRPSDGQVLIRTLWLSIDPTQRIWMARDSYKPAVPLGDVMQSFAVGQVIESRYPEFKRGDLVRGEFGWQDYLVTDGKGFGGMQKVAPGTPPNLALSLFGVNGLTAYFGMIEIGKIKVGETVVVSGAAGATGSVAGQIAKIKMTWALILASVR